MHFTSANIWRLSVLLLLFVGTVLAESTPRTTAEPAKIVVDVSGEVRKPGIYKFDAGQRVGHAIDAAGGTTRKADTMDINLAAPLLDATRLHIPTIPNFQNTGANNTLTNKPTSVATAINPPEYTRTGWLWLKHNGQLPATAGANTGSGAHPSRQSGSAIAPDPKSAQINLNTASKTELETLPGIGPATADKIIAFREKSPFRSVEDLQQVPGIGPKKLEAVRDLVRVEK